MRSLTVASDGSLVVAANNKGVCYVWRLQRGMQTTAHFEPLHKLQASPRRSVDTTSTLLLDFPSRIAFAMMFLCPHTRRAIRQAHDGYILKCLLSPDVRVLATASSDKTVKLWNLDGFKLEKTLEGHQRWVWDCVFSVDAAYLVTASSDTTARLWDCSSGEAIRIYSGHHKAAVCCALNDSAVDG